MSDLKIVIAQDEGGLSVVAGHDYELLQNTIQEFGSLCSDDDFNEDIGGIDIGSGGWVALARRV